MDVSKKVRPTPEVSWAEKVQANNSRSSSLDSKIKQFYLKWSCLGPIKASPALGTLAKNVPGPHWVLRSPCKQHIAGCSMEIHSNVTVH